MPRVVTDLCKDCRKGVAILVELVIVDEHNHRAAYQCPECRRWQGKSDLPAGAISRLLAAGARVPAPLTESDLDSFAADLWRASSEDIYRELTA